MIKLQHTLYLCTMPNETINASKMNRALTEALRKDMLSFPLWSAKAHDYWWFTASKIKELVEQDDPYNFTNWEFIKTTMFFSPGPHEYLYLKQSKYWKQIEPLLNEDPVGNPPRYELAPQSSGNLVHHFFSLMQLYEHFEIDLNKVSSIMEFGGGYGSFCRVMHKMGYKNKYRIFDLPVLSCLQKYYLGHISPSFSIHYNGQSVEHEPAKPGMRISLLNDLAYLTQHPELIEETDFFIALWSISESPVVLRNFFFNRLKRCRYFLIGYQQQFEDMDNMRYFETLPQQFEDIEWKHIRIPDIANNYYLLGARKE